MKTRDPIIVYTVVSEPDHQVFGYRTERMALHRDVPAGHTCRRGVRDMRPYRIAWRPDYGDQSFNSWRKSCLGSNPGYLGPFIGDGSTEAALAWLLEGEEKCEQKNSFKKTFAGGCATVSSTQAP